MPLDFEFVSTQFSPLVVSGAPPEMFDKSRIALQWNEPQMKIKLSGKLPEPYRDDQLVYYTISTLRKRQEGWKARRKMPFILTY
jgi:hypothetical protein